jgi:oligopeptide/dipeptide ABC transporter ATP-binding protein
VSRPLLEVRDLAVHFPPRRGSGKVRAVDGVSFELDRGAKLALVGESGSGKSTTAQALVGLHLAARGSLRFDGHELAGLRQRAWRPFRRRIQIVFQDPATTFDPRQTVGAILRQPLDVHRVGKPRERRMRALAVLEAVGLETRFYSRFPHELSGGQAQRVALARALVIEPELLICDEPLSALDASVRAQIVNLLRDLVERFELALIFITHDLGLARFLCEQVAVMYLGRLVERGPREVLLAQPTHPYTRALLSAVPYPDPAAERARARVFLAGEVPSPSNPPSGCAFHPRCPERAAVPGERCSGELPALLPLEVLGAQVQVACHLHHR